MAVSVAEYLGVRTDSSVVIVPIQAALKPTLPCPFRNDKCGKLKLGQPPVCSVRDSGGSIWIVCEHRLCATQPTSGPVSEHQRGILMMVGSRIFEAPLTEDELLIRREVKIPITEQSDYKADFVMWRKNAVTGKPIGGDRASIVEMQGGGETSGTEKITKHIKDWAALPCPTNEILAKLTGANPLVTNAWRRQQEQFLVKGNVATLTGARMVFCVGVLLYDYLTKRLTSTNLKSLTDDGWNLALLAFREDADAAAPLSAPNSIQFQIDPERTLFTSYPSFVQALTNQGNPQPQVFTEKFTDLFGNMI